MLLLPTADHHAHLRVAWSGPSVLVLDATGEIGRTALAGFYFRQARFLDRLRLEIEGEEPFPCSICAVGPDVLEHTALFPEVEQGGGGGSGSGRIGRRHGVLHRAVDILTRFRVRPASLEVTTRLTSRWEDADVEVSWLVGADYRSIDEANFDARQQDAPVRSRPVPGGAAFCYQHPDLPLSTLLRAEGAHWEFDDDRFRARLTLRRQQAVDLRLVVRACDFDRPLEESDEKSRERVRASWIAGTATLHAPAESPLVDITNGAVRDLGWLALLDGEPGEWLTPAAGVPLYVALWGRDAATAAWQSGLFDRGDLLSHVVAYLARRQGTRVDPSRDEEPGRILMQARTDPLTRLGRTPFDRYYADFASPFMFLIGLGYLYTLTGDIASVEPHWQAALRVLEWAREYGDRDGDGYVEYCTQAPAGPTHQGWRDSENAMVDHLGRPVAPPIAPSEIQGYWYGALQLMALLSVARRERSRALALWREAADLKQRFNRDFWLEDEGFVALGLDAEKRPIRALTSNAGHCLATGIVDQDNVSRLVRRLFEPDLFSGWGIRTLSARNPAYNPLDYHLGSVWAVENASIVFGLRRYGFDDRVLQLTRGLYDLARLWPDGRVPECVGGYARDEAAHPGVYPRANRPQTWNQSVWPLLVQSILGIVPYAPMKLLLVDPILPPWLPEIALRGLRVGDATATLRFHRQTDGDSTYEVVRLQGDLRIVRQPWLESFSTSPWDRLRALGQTLGEKISPF